MRIVAAAAKMGCVMPQPTMIQPLYPAVRPPVHIPMVLRWLMAPVVGGVLGVVLGYWCRTYAATLGPNGALADLGAPWIAAAFIAGAAPMLAADRRVRAQIGSAFTGALGGSACLVVATVVYYGPARTGHLDVTGARGATFVWTIVSLGVGVVVGAAGALWRSAPNVAQAAVCLVAVGTAITSEAYYLLDAGGFHDSHDVLVLVAIVGAAVPLLLGLRWQAVVGVALVAVLAIPGSLAAEIVWRGASDSLSLLHRR